MRCNLRILTLAGPVPIRRPFSVQKELRVGSVIKKRRKKMRKHKKRKLLKRSRHKRK
jgi:hypothetical protein